MPDESSMETMAGTLGITVLELVMRPGVFMYSIHWEYERRRGVDPTAFAGGGP